MAGYNSNRSNFQATGQELVDTMGRLQVRVQNAIAKATLAGRSNSNLAARQAPLSSELECSLTVQTVTTEHQPRVHKEIQSPTSYQGTCKFFQKYFLVPSTWVSTSAEVKIQNLQFAWLIDMRRPLELTTISYNSTSLIKESSLIFTAGNSIGGHFKAKYVPWINFMCFLLSKLITLKVAKCSRKRFPVKFIENR